MIDDPDAPGFRAPDPGEVFWHYHWEEWVRVCEDQASLMCSDETTVRFGDGTAAIVKLKSLDPADEAPVSAGPPPF